MAATQAEPQQNEVNRDLVQQEQPPSLGNTGLQNGTDKSGSRSISGSDVAGSKGKIVSQNSLPVEMSQYRQESGAGPPLHNSDQNANSSDDVAGKINNSDNKPYSHNSEQSGAGAGDQNYGKGPSDNGNQNMQGYGLPFSQRPGYHHPEQSNPMQMGSENSLHHQNNSYGQFNPQNMRHGYPGAKPIPGPPRPPSGGSSMNSPASNFPHVQQQQRILSGQSISQPTGPTPTLNQLLQSSNPVHRYQNSYGDYSMQKSGDQPQGNLPYNQTWPPPRSMPPYGPQQGAPGYRNQPSSVQVQGNRGGQVPYLGASGGGSPGYPPPASPGTPASSSQYPPGGSQYPPYPQRYPTPPSAAPGPGPGPGPNAASNAPARQPYSPHQLGSPYAPGSGPGPQNSQQQQQQQQQQQNQQAQTQPQPQSQQPPQQSPQQSQSQQQSQQTGNPGQSPSQVQQNQQQNPQPPPQQQNQQPSQQQQQQQQQAQQQQQSNQGSNGNYSSDGRWPPPPSPNTTPTLPSPQPPPQPSPQPQPPPPSPQHQSFPSRPQQASTPNAHGPDAGDLTGGNSNDSCSGPAPGTPNSQGMRPTPSPTGSTGSRSMSPAVGQQNIPMPPRPSSSQSDGGSNAGPTRISHSPIGAQGVYPQQLAPPSHMHNYKMGGPGPGPGPGMVPQQQMPPSPYSNPAQQQYPQQGNYSPRPQGQMQYGPNQSYGQQNPQANNMPGGPGSQYPTRPLLNHVPHTQFGGYQGWGGPGMNQGPPPGAMMGGPGPGGPGNNHIAGSGGKGGPQATPPPPQNQQTSSQPSNASPGPRSHTPPNYLKHHLQHKVGFGSTGASSGMPPSPGSYGSNSGPPHHHPMGPPPHHPGMGPPPTMGPPPPNSHHEAPMPPPSSTPNSHPVMPHSEISSDMHDNGITTTASGTVMTSVSGSQTGGVTSVVTTGPDGAPMDEASQQSTLSNASAASGEDPSCTPGKSRGSGNKDSSVLYHHPNTPQSTAPSPGAASMNSMHDEYPPDSSPTWPRTPASPVFNSHVPQDLYRTKKHDSLGKLYEMDETVERRLWLDKLLQFMEDRGTPISACPTISKNPLDLFRLYLYVKERGGFMEVCKVQCSSMVTKNKIWKDIAGLLGIGASSSAAYTLRKHYTKNLLPFECHFDRGGIDPQPIINQVEATTKKKGSKANPVPSPGSSNSQDSFPTPGSGGSGSMDGYGYGYPPDYNNQRPPSQTNQGMQGGYQNQGGYTQYPDQYNQQYPAPAPGPNYPPNRPIYPPTPYGPEAERGYTQASSASQGTAAQPGGQDPYRGYMGPGAQPPGYPPRAGYPPQPPGPTGAAQTQGTPPNQQPEYYRPDQVYQGQTGGPGPAAGYPGTPPSKAMPPPTNQPRRHPDFATKDQQPGPYPPYNQQRPAMYPGWSSTNNNQYRGPTQFAGQTASTAQWTTGGPPRPGGPPTNQQPPPGTPQWDQHRYPPSAQPPFQSPQQWGMSGMNNSVGPQTSLRSPMGPRPNFRPEGKQFNQMGASTPSMKQGQGVGVQTGVKREMVFPLDSVEAVTPVLYKRRRLTKQDVAPVDAWRLMMALRSGLLAETCWALDVLNILLFDDNAIAYFGLVHLPGLLDTLLEHFRRALNDMLEPPEEPAPRLWYERPVYEEKDVDLGCVEKPPDPRDRVTFMKGPDHTLRTRRGTPVSIVPAQEDIFVLDTRRSWDKEEIFDEASCDQELTKYIVPCFRGDFGIVPFVRVLEDKEPKENYKESTSDSRTKPVNSDMCSRIIKEEKVEIKKELEVKKEPVSNPLADRIKDPAGTLKRRRISDYEDECYSRDEASLSLVTESQDAIARRCICLSNILRNLTFVPGNELEFAKNMSFLGLLGRLLLMHHEHPLRTQKQRNYDREEDADFGDCCSSLQGDSEWWWEYLHHLRENALVCAANIAGHVDLEPCAEDISRPLLDGLLHWAVCPAAQGQDPFPTVGPTSMLSPQKLALEALTKLCVTDANVDLVIATPPYSRLERLCAVLTRLLCRSEEQVLREFAVNLLHYLAAADSGMSRVIALQSPCVSLLVAFIEQAEASALGVANQHGINALRDNPDCMGTSLDMLRRTARTLLHLSKHPDNRPLFLEQEQRLLALVMSQILDQQVAALISRVLFHCSRPSST